METWVSPMIEALYAEPIGDSTPGEWSVGPYWERDHHAWRIITSEGYIVADRLSRADAELIVQAVTKSVRTSSEPKA